jgi:hypothetical protein
VRVEKEITVLPAPLGPTIRVKGLEEGDDVLVLRVEAPDAFD